MMLAYGRVSTKDQARPDRVSLEEQMNRCKAVAQFNNLSGQNFREFIDRGVSGAVALYKRPAGISMLAAAKEGDIIVASKLDRIFRSTSDALNTIERLRRKGIDIIICDIHSEPMSSSPVAKMFFTVMSAMAEFERHRIHERILEGKAAKKSRGGHTGGVAPHGYRIEGHGRTAVLVPDEKEQYHVKLARKLRGISWIQPLKTIATEMAEEGCLNRDGKPYSPAAVWRILQKNPAPRYAEDAVQL